MRTIVAKLAAKIRAAERGTASDQPGRGQVHEWFADGPAPLCLFVHLARQVAAPVAWIGRRVWLYPHAAMRCDPDAARQWLLVDPPDVAARLWAIDLALRSGALGAVIADGSRLDMAATRRLQLAAEANGSLALLARPLREQRELSAASARWRVACEPSDSAAPRWRIEMLRCKADSRSIAASLGVEPSDLSGFSLEYDRATGAVVIPADVVGRSGTSAQPSTRRIA